MSNLLTQRSGPVTLAASVEGPAGAPVVVLGNSLGTTRAVWDPQAAVLRRRFRLLRYELRGHAGPVDGSGAGQDAAGQDAADEDASGPACSPAPTGPYSMDELGADVLALLDAHAIDRAAYCGISLGGMIGMWLAASAPDRITCLALCCTSAYLPPASLWQARAAQVRSGGMTAIAEQVVGRWFTPAFRGVVPAVPASFVTQLERVDPEGYAGCCDAIATMDLRPSLASITAPTLVLAGAQDPATPPWHGAVIASGISGARLAVIRGAAHLANVSMPGEVTAALLGHLTTLVTLGRHGQGENQSPPRP